MLLFEEGFFCPNPSNWSFPKSICKFPVFIAFMDNKRGISASTISVAIKTCFSPIIAGMLVRLVDVTITPSPNLKGFELSCMIIFSFWTAGREDLNSSNHLVPQTVLVAPQSRTAQDHVSASSDFSTTSFLACKTTSFIRKVASAASLSGHLLSQWLMDWQMRHLVWIPVLDRGFLPLGLMFGYRIDLSSFLMIELRAVSVECCSSSS